LRAGLRDLDSFFILPEATPNSDPSWFGFPLMVRPDAPFSRAEWIHFLEERKIASRALFGGNLVRQPAYADVRYRAIGDLPNSDLAMKHVFWIGVYPGLRSEMIDYVLETFHQFASQRRAAAHVPIQQR